ncbi:cystatin-A1-like [Pyxicephalus adspersus]|uniref:cystatin-A1-like n=1 Tax=Pyxicephalus adspersus TaxID=30357 RepID=UPI003B59F63B
MSHVGGVPYRWSPARKPTAEVQKIADEVKEQFVKKSGKYVSRFTLILYRIPIYSNHAIVTAMDIMAKIHIGGNKYIHMRVKKPTSVTNQEAQIMSFQLDKEKDDELEPFSDGE